MASPHHRHQFSLEEIIDFDALPPLTDDVRTKARAQFYHIVGHFEAAYTRRHRGPYNRPALVRLTFEYARPGLSQDNFLRAFFPAMALSMDDPQNPDLDNPSLEQELCDTLTRFAEFLVDNFFLPCM